MLELLNQGWFSSTMGIIGLVIGISGIILVLLLYFVDVRKKINLLIEREIEVIPFGQAKALAELYFITCQTKFNLSLHSFFSKELEELIKTKNEEAISRFASCTGDDVIKQIRDKMLPFKISRNRNFKEFLNDTLPLDSGIVLNAFIKCKKIFKDMEEGIIDFERGKYAILNTVEDGGREGERKVKEMLKQSYSKKGFL